MATGVMTGAFLPLIKPLLSLTEYAPNVKTQMADYMYIRAASMVAIIGTETLGNWYGGLGNTWMQMVAGIIAMVANVFLNWIFINGELVSSRAVDILSVLTQIRNKGR